MDNMNFKEYMAEVYEADKDIEFRRVDEAGLSRVYNMLSNDVEFAFISAFRKFDSEGKPISLKENQARNNNLLKDLRSILGNPKAYGSFRLIGHWKECSVRLGEKDKISDCERLGGVLTNALEESWGILNDQKNPKFFDALKEVAKKYDQDCFVARVNGKFGVFSKSGEQWESFKSVNDKTIQRGLEAVMDVQGYSENRNTRQKGRLENIIFKNESFDIYLSIPDSNIASHQLYKSMNILWR